MEERDLFEDFDNILFEDDNINWKELAEDVSKEFMFACISYQSR